MDWIMFFHCSFSKCFCWAAVSVVVESRGPVDIFTYRIICFRDRRCAVVTYIYISVYIYIKKIYIYICMMYNHIVCVCLCEDVILKGWLKEKKYPFTWYSGLYYVYYYISPGQEDCREVKLKSTNTRKIIKNKTKNFFKWNISMHYLFLFWTNVGCVK